MDFLRRRRLPESEYYDVVIFRYLRTVQLYCTKPQLHRYKFETIAFKAMDWQLKSYWRKTYHALHKTLSLDAQLAGFARGTVGIAAHALGSASRRLFQQGDRWPHRHVMRSGGGYVFVYPKHCDCDGMITQNYA